MDRERLKEIESYYKGSLEARWKLWGRPGCHVEELIAEVEASWAREFELRRQRDALRVHLDDAGGISSDGGWAYRMTP